jgi:hypothetical protein
MEFLTVIFYGMILAKWFCWRIYVKDSGFGDSGVTLSNLRLIAGEQ